MVKRVKGSRVELRRGEEPKRRAVNQVKRLKLRRGEENRETRRKEEEDPYIDICIEELRRRIKQEEGAADGTMR